MFAEGLLNNEKLTLYALARFPLYNDRELSNIIPINMSTLTAIRNRLQRKGFIKTYRLPRLDLINSEMVFALWCEIRNPLDAADREILEKEICNNFPEIFYSIYDADSLFCLGYSNSFIEQQKRIDLVIERLSRKRILMYDKLRLFLFPSALSEITYYFDTSEFLYGNLQLERALVQIIGNDRIKISKIMEVLRPFGQNERRTVPADGRTNLRKKELRVLYGLVGEPTGSDERIARNVGVTRQMVSRSRKDFEKNGLVRTKRIPILGRLGLGILAVCSLSFRPDVPREEWRKTCNGTFRDNLVMFSIIGRFEALGIFPCRDFASLKKLKGNLFSSFTEKEYLCRSPRFSLLSLPLAIQLKEFIFTPFIKSSFDIHLH